MGKRIFAIMLVVLILCSILVVPAYADVLPGFFDPSLPLTGEMIQSVYYTFLNLLGLRGNIDNQIIAYNQNPYYFTNEQLAEFVLEQSVINNWNNIKDYFIEDGTITYSDGRTVPRWKLEVTSENVNDIKLFAKDIQDKQFALYNYNMAQGFTWTDISHVYGGYLSYAQQFVSLITYTQLGTTTIDKSWQMVGIDNPIHTSGDDPTYYYYRTFGMDLYLGNSHNSNTVAPIVTFNSDTDTFAFQNQPGYYYIVNKSLFGAQSRQFRIYYVFPVTITNTGTISLTISERDQSVNSSSDPNMYWGTVALLDSTGYSNFINNLNNADPATLRDNNSVGKVVSNNPGTASYNVSGGTFYIIANLQMVGSTSRSFTMYKNYNIENNFDVLIDDNTTFGVWNVDGIPRGYGWSVDITDSGTGTVTTIPDAVSTVEDGVFDIGSVLYFPGAVTNVPEMVDILNGDMVITGEGAITDPDNPSNPQNESVSVDIIPPASLGLASIWHYVSDTAVYCASFLSVLVGNIFSIIPTPIFNIAFAAVVLGILFGLYKRFIE